MSEQWQHQLRIDLDDVHAAALRGRTDDPALAGLTDILRRHGAEAISQFDAFAGYCAEAEREGIDRYPLYHWTKATIENPAKQAKYRKSFTLYLDGQEVYPADRADVLERELRPLVGSVILRLRRHDTNPANNPQPPAREALG